MPDATATADALSAALARMQFLEDARNAIRQLKIKLTTPNECLCVSNAVRAAMRGFSPAWLT